MNFAPLAAAGTAVQIHVAAALLSVLLGIAMFALRKGTPLHKALGRAWVTAMLVVAIGSFWITGLAGKTSFSPIHALSAFTVVSLGVAIWAIRTGRRVLHRNFMVGTFLGLVAAGAGTLIPGRILARVVGIG